MRMRAAVELGDVVDALVEQVAVVGDHQHGAVEAVDQLLERVAPVHVEVRLGLVEQEQARPPRQAGRERDELALAAAQLAGRARERVVVEPERVQVGPRLVVGALAPELAPARQQPLLVGERALELAHVAGQRRVGEPLLGLGELALERRQLGPRVEHRGERGAVVALDDLRQRGEHEPAAARDRARVGVLDAGEDAQQRRLAAAVRAQDADPRPVGELEVELGQHRPPAERLDDARARTAAGPTLRLLPPGRPCEPCSIAAVAASRSSQPWMSTSLPSGCLYIE